jgi:hypothetical protein
MNPASLNDLKKELSARTYKELYDIILRMAKFKKENKELLSYLVMDSLDEADYIQHVKDAISADFIEANLYSLRVAKKNIRKILSNANKFIKYSGLKQTEVELLIHFCHEFIHFKVHLLYSPMLNNIFDRQIIKIKKALSTLHEDLQYDYTEEIKSLESVLLTFNNYY